MTGRALFNPQARDHLAKLLGLLGSSHDGEVCTAGRKAHEFITRLRLTWNDVLYSPPEAWWQMADLCNRHPHALSAKERDFVANITRMRRPPTNRQLDWLVAIYARLRREGAAA